MIGLLGCNGCPGPASKRTRRYKKSQLQKSLQKLESTGLVLGKFTLASRAVIDGDTVKVDGLRTTLRLLAIDTEETFKRDREKRLFETGWENYVRTLQGKRKKPAKYATPLGMEAKRFAERFFSGVRIVRLERDHPKEIRGRYNRYLVYVFAKKKGVWVNYNLECVRAGMSPYFTKYGYSRRFHDQFVEAQRQARRKKLGIWDPNQKHYPDYDVRLRWWNARAEFIKEFEQDAEGKDNYIVLTNWDALRRLEKHLGKEVVVLGTVGRIKLGDRGPTKVMLSRRRGADFPVVFFDKDVFGSSGIARYKGGFVRVRGRVSKWYNKYRKREVLQIVVNLPGQIQGNDEAPNFGRWVPERRAAKRPAARRPGGGRPAAMRPAGRQPTERRPAAAAPGERRSRTGAAGKQP
jgi:endonuclease YncB( thermonuclease family)